MRVAAWLSYNGEPFAGFARQNDQLTVQGSIEEALELLFRRQVETTCAGRTDAGVHALCQVVSFDLFDDEWFRRKPESLLKSLNALTHEAISFRSVRPMPEDFSARFSATAREYRYYICTDAAAPLLMEKFSWHLGKPLDVEKMKEASYYLLGEHDFKSFCMAVSAKGKPTHRYVAQISFKQEQIWNSNFVVMTVIGNAFLHSMVRTMVGTLVLVGLGKRSPEWVREVLQACNRQAAGQNAPAEGLVLWNVNYQEQHFYYDPRPPQLLGELEVERHLSEAIEDVPESLGEKLASSKKKAKDKAAKRKKSGKKAGKDAGGDGVPQASAPWAKWRQEKEKEREFVIPRGPNLDTSQTGELPIVVEDSQIAISAGAVESTQDARPSGAEKTEMPTGAMKVAASDFIVRGAPSPLKASGKISEPDEAKADVPAFTVESDPQPTATVLTAAGARQRRRARQAADHF